MRRLAEKPSDLRFFVHRGPFDDQQGLSPHPPLETPAQKE